MYIFVFFFSSRRRHTRSLCDWSSDVCSSDLWQKIRDSVEVKLYQHEGDLYVLAKSEGRQAKEIAMRRKRLARLLRKLRTMRRSEERRVGKECRARWSAWQAKKNRDKRRNHTV